MKHQNGILKFGLLAILFASTTACGFRGNRSGLHWFLDMHDNYAVEAQEEDPSTLEMVKGENWATGADSEAWGGPGSSIRVPPEGTVPRNYVPYPYAAADFDGAAEGLTNPLSATREVLERGKKEYDIYCAVCHGYTGAGDGNVIPPFPNTPPNLMTGAAKYNKDGWIFHMITRGRGGMKSYAAQINVADRWAIVHYVRLLQKSGEN